MNEAAKTGVFLLVGAAALGVAWLARPAQIRSTEVDDSGERFFAAFEPEQARSMEIIDFDEDSASPTAFKVAMVDGRWAIPSHEGYPADAKDHLAAAAASVMDVTKGPRVSDRPADHELFGVLDPTDLEVLPGGVGTRVTMRDETDRVLVDLIIGKPVKDNPAQHYVRIPGRDRVYTTTISTDELSTNFGDWIERDLLMMESGTIASINVNGYSIDELNNRIVQGDMLDFDRDEESGVWTLATLAEGEELNQAKLDEMRQALDDLQIVNVHRKPTGLGRELRTMENLRLDQTGVDSLMSRGYYIVQGQLLSNEGETNVAMTDGVIYTLRFGEVAMENAPAPSADPLMAQGLNRYLFITAAFDAELIARPEYEEIPEIPENPEPSSAPKAPGEAEDEPDLQSLVLEEARKVAEQRKADNESKRLEYEKKIADGQARMKQLNDRFADWYYVIADDVYKRIRLTRADVVQKATPTPLLPLPTDE